MKNLFIIPVLVFTIQMGFAQDMHFSMFSEMPVTLNPALSGVTFKQRSIVNYKNQWSSVGDKYETYGFSYEQTISHKRLKDNYFSAFANIYKDAAGNAKLNTLNPNLGLAYIQKLNRNMKLSAGLQGGMYYRSIDYDKLTWGEQFNGFSYDPNLASGEQNLRNTSLTTYDIGSGINFNFVDNDNFSKSSKVRFDIGVSAYHFGLAKNSFIVMDEKLQTKYCAYLNGEINIPKSKNALVPTFVYVKQGPQSLYLIGTLFKMQLGDFSTYTGMKKTSSVSVGTYYRYNDAIIPSVVYQFDNYMLGICYDVNVSGLTPATNRNGGIEFMLRYNVLPGYGTNQGRSDTRSSY